MTTPATATTIDDEISSVVELRRYRLLPGTREVLIDLFDREFVETQEAADMRVIGQFRDLDDPDSFVWLRGFRDMPSRAAALERFYTGSVWAAHRDQANGTMVNSDNVLLLRPASPGSGIVPLDEPRPQPGACEARPGLVVATIAYLAPRTEEAFVAFFEETLRPLLTVTQASAKVLATLVTERSPNTFPRLAIREGESVFVWLMSFPSLPAYESHLTALTRAEEWTRCALPEMARRTWRANEVWQLTPTGRSRLHG